MKIKLKNNNDISFIHSESANCWVGKGLINSTEVEFEIYEELYIQQDIDWEYFQNFVFKLEKNNSLPDLIKKSQILALNLSDAFYDGTFEDKKILDGFKMDFVGLSFQGKSEGGFTSSYSYSLWFNMIDKIDNLAYVDPYGAYIVDIEARFIVGAKREQY